MQKLVKIYTTPTCTYCKMAKEFFKQNKIQYEELDVVTNAKAREEMINKSGQMGVPVIFVGDDIVVGFDRSRLSELLMIK
ncbi:MAG TPA: Uxx-star family glutaredoxin-like (seleno)protein [Candidatus Paceibacterota bacterium]